MASLRTTAFRVLAIEAISVLALWWVGRVFGS